MKKKLKNLLFLLQLMLIVGFITSCDEEEISPVDVDITSPTSLEAVDLGLSVLWANVNLGAEKPEEYGLYFAWGETGVKDFYDWSSYSYCKGMDYTQMLKYSSLDGKKELLVSDDAASKYWEGGWRIPTSGQIEELRTRCTWTWETINDVEGYRIKGSNGKSIFIPAVGQKLMGFEVFAKKRGCYWTRTLGTSDDTAKGLVFERDTVDNDLGLYEDKREIMSFHRAAGCCIRPVTPKNQK